MHRCKHRIRASTAKKYRDTRVSEYPSSKTQRISRYACTPSSQKGGGGGQAPRTRDATFGEKAERANRFAKSFAKISSSRQRTGKRFCEIPHVGAPRCKLRGSRASSSRRIGRIYREIKRGDPSDGRNTLDCTVGKPTRIPATGIQKT